MFGAWDIFPDDAYEAATHRGRASSSKHLDAVKEELSAVRPCKPMAGAFFYPGNVTAEAASTGRT